MKKFQPTGSASLHLVPKPQHPSIVIDPLSLRQPSDSIAQDESDIKIVWQLNQIFNQVSALGLAAMQIGIRKRAFIAQLLENKRYIFINPSISFDNDTMTISTEGCLSLPGIIRSIERYRQVTIEAETIYDAASLSEVESPLHLEDLDAFVVQHEMDHLNGRLIIDHKEMFTEKQEKKRKKREQIKRARHQRKIAKKNKSQNQISAKRLKTLKKEAQKAKKRIQKSAEIQERFKMEMENC